MHPKFVKRIADVAADRIKKYGYQVANKWATDFLSKEDLREVNKEIERRNGKKV